MSVLLSSGVVQPVNMADIKSLVKSEPEMESFGALDEITDVR